MKQNVGSHLCIKKYDVRHTYAILMLYNSIMPFGGNLAKLLGVFSLRQQCVVLVSFFGDMMNQNIGLKGRGSSALKLFRSTPVHTLVGNTA